MDLISMIDSLEAGLAGFFTRHFLSYRILRKNEIEGSIRGGSSDARATLD